MTTTPLLANAGDEAGTAGKADASPQRADRRLAIETLLQAFSD